MTVGFQETGLLKPIKLEALLFTVDGKDVKAEIGELVSLLNKYSAAYYRDARPIVSDAEYDRLYDRLVRLEGEHPELKLPTSPTCRVGDDTIQGFEDVAHTIPVLSLDKAYGVSELEDFRDRVIKAASAAGKSPDDLVFALEEKIDGLSMVLYYEKGKFARAVTRGNGSVGSDVSGSIRTIRSVPLELAEPIDIAVRGEVYLNHESFVRINSQLEEPYANARNLAAGLIKRQKSSEIAGTGLDIFVYEGFADENFSRSHREMLSKLKTLGFRTNPHVEWIGRGDFQLLPDIVARKTQERKSLGYDIDGLVMKVDDFSVREELGYTEHHPRWAIAYKFESPVARSVLRRIDVQVGRTGRATPVAVFDRTPLLGSYIENATLHNKWRIGELEIAIGDEISFSKRGDVIPQVEEVLEKNSLGNTTFRFPDKCPVCGEKLTDVGKNTFCLNRECSARKIGEAAFFVSKEALDIEGIGAETIRDLWNLGLLKDYPDIYSIDYDRDLFGKLDYKEKKIANIKDGIAKSLSKPFLSVLVAVQIPDIGKKSAELLIGAGFDSFEKLRKVAADGDVAALSSVPGIGEKTAANIIAAFSDPEFLARLDRLEKAGLKVCAEAGDDGVISNALEGQVWCVTGSIAGYKNPDLALEEVRRRGARIVSSVSGKTTHLLVGSKPGSKLQKAIANGKTIIVKEEDYKSYWEGK